MNLGILYPIPKPNETILLFFNATILGIVSGYVMVFLGTFVFAVLQRLGILRDYRFIYMVFILNFMALTLIGFYVGFIMPLDAWEEYFFIVVVFLTVNFLLLKEKKRRGSKE